MVVVDRKVGQRAENVFCLLKVDKDYPLRLGGDPRADEGAAAVVVGRNVER